MNDTSSPASSVTIGFLDVGSFGNAAAAHPSGEMITTFSEGKSQPEGRDFGQKRAEEDYKTCGA